MADISGGSLHFTSTMDNDQLNAAIDETMRRVQGLSDGTVAGGKKMDSALNVTAESIRAALGQIGAACETHEQSLLELEKKYQELGRQASEAFMAGRDGEARAIQEERSVISGEMAVRKQLIDELHEQSNALEDAAAKQEENRQKTAANEQTQISMRSRIRELKEEMMVLSDQGIDQNSAAYKRLVDELGRLQDIQEDVSQQGRILANDQSTFQGVISGLQGMAGGFSAVTGAMSLFAGENEDLQQVMTKVQSVMAITMGVQQVSESLNKDSAFQLVTLTKLKGWWADCVAKATAAETAETTATVANTAAKKANATTTAANTASAVANTAATGAQATAATAGTAANIGLAGAFRLVGVAIKSVPVFGWIIAGISALIAAVSHFASVAGEAKKAMEEFSKAIAEGCYKPIGAVQQLSIEYTALGNNIKAKEQFIIDNKKRFDDLGVSINSVADAENLLIVNKDRFILAQIAKAKAAVYAKQAMDKAAALIAAQNDAANMPDKVQRYNSLTRGYDTVENSYKKSKNDEIKRLNDEMMKGFENSYIETKNQMFNMKKGEMKATDDYEKGTVGAIRKAIAAKQAAMEHMVKGSAQWNKANAELERMQRQISNSGSNGSRSTGGAAKSSSEDAFTKELNAKKQKYDDYLKWVNSGLEKEAAVEFATLIEQGKNYKEYLEKKRAELEANGELTVAQQKQLYTVLNELANESGKGQIDIFNESLEAQLSGIETAMGKLEEIKKLRADINKDGNNDPLKVQKNESLDNAEDKIRAQQGEDTKALLANYSSYLDKKIQMEQTYNNDVLTLENALQNAKSDAERAQIERTMQERQQAFAKDTMDMSFDQLKLSPEYVRAFDDLRNTSTETLEFLLAEFDKVKESAAGSLNPMDLQAYIQAMTSITDELNGRNPFDAIRKGYKELEKAAKTLKNAERQLNQIRMDGGQGTAAEQKAIKEVNRAKDEYIKKNQEVKKSEKEVRDTVKKLCDGLSDVGDAIGGQAGEIISLIGMIGTFTMSAIDGFKMAAEAGSQAIQSVERASVILAIISTAMQVVTKIASIFAGDDGTAAYERSTEVYKAYIDIIDDVIDKQKELMNTMAGQDAKNSFKTAIELIEKEAAAARELGKQYLNAGASGGSHSHGVSQRKNMSEEAVKQLYDVAQKYGINAQEVMNGRMVALFDLTVEQMKNLRNDAMIFWANLDEDTREYLDDIIESEEKLAELEATYKESMTGVDFESMSDDFVSILQDMDSDAQDFADAFSEYMRKAMINNMFKAQFREQLNKWYDMWSDAMDAGSDEGETISQQEQAALDTLKNSIVAGATAAADAINAQFQTPEEEDTSLTGAVKGVTEETASLVAGQMNAIRINQLESAELLRNQLSSLAAIAANTSYNRFLQSIDQRLAQMQTAESSLRSQGLNY